jgi:hypothetical protein
MALKTQIGETAGEVWRLLSDEGPQTSAQLKKKVKVKGEVVDYALGWLAREDKIDFLQEKRTTRIQLK